MTLRLSVQALILSSLLWTAVPLCAQTGTPLGLIDAPESVLAVAAAQPEFTSEGDGIDTVTVLLHGGFTSAGNNNKNTGSDYNPKKTSIGTPKFSSLTIGDGFGGAGSTVFNQKNHSNLDLHIVLNSDGVWESTGSRVMSAASLSGTGELVTSSESQTIFTGEADATFSGLISDDDWYYWDDWYDWDKWDDGDDTDDVDYWDDWKHHDCDEDWWDRKDIIIKTGDATQVLAGRMTSRKAIYINQGTLQFGKRISLYDANTSLWTAKQLTVAAGATAAFNVGGTGEFTAKDIDHLKTLSIPANSHGCGGGGFLDGSTLGLDTTNAGSGGFTYNGIITDTADGMLGLAKLGSNTLTLTNHHTYTGYTTVQGGELRVAGSLASDVEVFWGSTLNLTGEAQVKGNVLVLPSGKLTGVGAVQGMATVTGGATHSPGGGLGVQGFGGLSYAGGSVFEWELGSKTTTQGSPFAVFDQVNVSGQMTVSDGAIFKVILGTPYNSADSFWQSSHTWDVFHTEGIEGGFNFIQVFYDNNLADPSNALVSLGGAASSSFSYSNNGTTGQLNYLPPDEGSGFNPVPEPGNLLAGLLVLAGLLRRHRPERNVRKGSKIPTKMCGWTAGPALSGGHEA